MNECLVFAAAGWVAAVPLILAAWHSPEVLLNISRQLTARADALKAARALYKVIHRQTMEGNNR